MPPPSCDPRSPRFWSGTVRSIPLWRSPVSRPRPSPSQPRPSPSQPRPSPSQPRPSPSRPRPSPSRPAPPARRCTKCGREKPLAEFQRDRTSPTGRRYRCRDCCNAALRAYRARHREKTRAQNRRYNRKRHDARVAYQRRPEVRKKQAARQLVCWAVKCGLLEKPDRCRRCGTEPPPRRLHAHHPDYTKPLDVIWLCSLCHGREHRRKAE